MAIRGLLVVMLAVVVPGALSAAPAPFAKAVRPKPEVPFDLLRREFAEKSKLQIAGMTQIESGWLVEVIDGKGEHVATVTVDTAPTRHAALRKLIRIYDRREITPPPPAPREFN